MAIETMPMCSPCIRPKKVSTAPASAKPAALIRLRSMMQTTVAPRINPPSGEPPPSILQAAIVDALVEHARSAKLVRTPSRCPPLRASC